MHNTISIATNRSSKKKIHTYSFFRIKVLPLSSNFHKVSSSKRPFSILFAGLKNGKHEFDFELDNTFFEEYEYSGIEGGNGHVKLILDKKETMLIGDFFVQGTVDTTCDRCTDALQVQMDVAFKQYFKFGSEDSGDEALTVLHPDEYQIDVKDLIYEFIVVSLPSRLLHPEGECNEEMKLAMEKHIVNLDQEDEEDFDDEEEDDDDESPWSILKDLN